MTSFAFVLSSLALHLQLKQTNVPINWKSITQWCLCESIDLVKIVSLIACVQLQICKMIWRQIVECMNDAIKILKSEPFWFVHSKNDHILFAFIQFNSMPMYKVHLFSSHITTTAWMHLLYTCTEREPSKREEERERERERNAALLSVKLSSWNHN